jgi:hypothetical protein
LTTGYCHHVPGRLRVRSSIVKGNPAAAAVAERRIVAFTGVHGVQVSTVTGSLTIYYATGKTGASALMHELHSSGYLPECNEPASRQRSNYAGDAAEDLASCVARALAQKALERAIGALIGAIL